MTLYFADFAAECGMASCDWCGTFLLQESLRPIQVDADAAWVEVCDECLEAYDWAHTTKED